MKIPQSGAISPSSDPIGNLSKENEGRDDDEPDGSRAKRIPKVCFKRIDHIFGKYLSAGSPLPRSKCRIAKSGRPAFTTGEAFWLCLRE